MAPAPQRLRHAALAFGLLVGLRAAPARAAEPMPLRPDLQIPIILKILTYDRHLASKAGSELVVGVVYAPADQASVQVANTVGDVLFRYLDKTVKGLPIRRYLLAYKTPQDLERSVTERGISVLYVVPGNAKNLEGILEVSKACQATSTTGVPEYVRRGVAVGVGLSDDRPQILIHLPSARAEGSEFDPSLLRIAVPVVK